MGKFELKCAKNKKRDFGDNRFYSKRWEGWGCGWGWILSQGCTLGNKVTRIFTKTVKRYWHGIRITKKLLAWSKGYSHICE